MRKIICLVMVFSLALVLSGCKSGGGSAGSGAAGGVASLTSSFLNEDPLNGIVIAGGGEEGLNVPVVGPEINDPDLNLDDDPHVNPEPSTLIMFVMSIVGLFGYRIRMRKART